MTKMLPWKHSVLNGTIIIELYKERTVLIAILGFLYVFGINSYSFTIGVSHGIGVKALYIGLKEITQFCKSHGHVLG